MAENDGQERTERATPRRQEQAREKGQAARSRELGTALVVLAGCAGLYGLGARVAGDLADLMAAGLTLGAADARATALPAAYLGDAFAHAGRALAPWLALVGVAALAGPALMGGLRPNPGLIAFKGSRLDPVQGFKRLFGTHGPFEALKGLLKFVCVAAAALALLWWQGPRLLGLGQMPVAHASADGTRLLVQAALLLALPLTLIAAIDVPFALWRHRRDLRMTRQEVRDELKETDARPEVRARQRARASEMARQRLGAVVPVADVVLVNPTHYAVALKYDAARGGAPRLTAKGADALAARIRELASEHGVPVLEQPPLTRALYHSTRVGAEIPAALYAAAAQVLAYVYRLRVTPHVPAPECIDVPEPARPGRTRP